MQRTIGQFLAVELDLDNLNVHLGKGDVVLKAVDLNVEVRAAAKRQLTLQGLE
jgi:hypothetical protein